MRQRRRALEVDHLCDAGRTLELALETSPRPTVRRFRRKLEGAEPDPGGEPSAGHHPGPRAVRDGDGGHLDGRVLLVLGYLNVPLAPFFASAGIAGVALGFGAQSIVKDTLSRFFILLENQFGVGDVVQLQTTAGPVTGKVESLTLRVDDAPGLRRHAAHRAERQHPARQQQVAGLGPGDRRRAGCIRRGRRSSPRGPRGAVRGAPDRIRRCRTGSAKARASSAWSGCPTMRWSCGWSPTPGPRSAGTPSACFASASRGGSTTRASASPMPADRSAARQSGPD